MHASFQGQCKEGGQINGQSLTKNTEDDDDKVDESKGKQKKLLFYEKPLYTYRSSRTEHDRPTSTRVRPNTINKETRSRGREG